MLPVPLLLLLRLESVFGGEFFSFCVKTSFSLVPVIYLSLFLPISLTPSKIHG